MFQLPKQFALSYPKSSGTFREVLSPNDAKILSSVQEATSDDIKFILSHNAEAQSTMNQLKAHERAKILKSVASQIQQNAEELAWLIASEGAKPLKDARIEVARSQSTLELCAEETMRIGGEVLPMQRTAAGENHLSIVTRMPIGPVLAISAFNHPLNLLAHQVGSALASGCCLTLKPASTTPLSAFKLHSYFMQAGLPQECFILINASIDLMEKLVASSEFAFVSFIGSAKVGWAMRRKIADGTRISMEHGGQAPAIVCQDADLDKAIPALIKSSFYHAGQVCISTQRIFVHSKIKDVFINRFVEEARKLKVGDARDAVTDVGPLITAKEALRVHEWVNEAIALSAKLLLGNELKENFLSVTILEDVPRNARAMAEEIFGPVVCINSYEDENELITYLNSNRFIFESCLFTQDITRALKIANEMITMTLVINDHSAYRVDWMPFGGHRMSGLGIGGVHYAIEEQTALKQIILKQ